ncbi:MAG: tetratricopeptide repeat protein, partial [Bacilli bacterium]|nr:tetratricopeptide repeat protein [Bacilli bacterium]
MTKEERKTAFNIFIKEGRDLTTKELALAGFSEYDLKVLRKDVLVSEGRGEYTLNDIDLLYLYGKALAINDKKDEAIKCYKKCLELDSNYNKAATRLMVSYLSLQNYQEMFKY